ncbi:MAG: MoaD/ThiS family protein [Bacilli bacterium]
MAISLINGVHKPLDELVKDHDNVYLFPPVAGG